MEKSSAIIIGAGIGGLATACLLAKKGYSVTILEKNESVGGRAGYFEESGFRFDMGPSWYLMPDIFEQFYTLLDEDVNEHLDLVRLSPSYRIFFKDTDLPPKDFYADYARDSKTFEELEPGSADALKIYLEKSKQQYEIARDRFIYKNYDSILDFLTWELMKDGTKLSVFSRMQNYVERYFKTKEVQKIMQYSLVFLGSSPYNTPAIYNIMSHIDFNMGVFYPMGGIYEFIKSLENIAKKHGTVIRTHVPVKKILVTNKKATGVKLENGEILHADIVISNADMYHTEQYLLEASQRDHSLAYWENRTLAPSAFLLYLGMNKRVPNISHHTLIFSADWEKNFGEIFDSPVWPEDPSLYMCAPSKTDPSVAPQDKENLVVLVPIAAGLEDSDEESLNRYEKHILGIIAKTIGMPDFEESIEVRRRFTGKDFASRYNAQNGTALGLAHTLFQTAIFRPNNKSKKVKNLYYVGGTTNPGIGMPMCLISAELVIKRLNNDKSSGALTSL